MNNKVLVELIVPMLETNYDVYIPINKKVGDIIENLSKIVSDMSGGYFIANKTRFLYNGNTGDKYSTDQYIIETDIRNSSKLILM